MKKQRRISRYLSRATILSATAIILFSSILTLIPIQPAFAAGEDYALYFGDDPGTQRAVADAWSGKNDYGDPGWSKMSVLATGGLWGEAATLAFDEQLTNEFGQNGAGTTTGNEPFFSKRYFCSKDDGQNKITFTRPAEDKEYYEVFYAVGLQSTDNDGDSFVTRKDYDAAKGVASVQSFAIKDGNNFNRRTTVYDITTSDKGPGDLAKADGNQNGSEGRFGISDANQKCRPEVGNMNLPRFNGLSATQKEQFKKAAEAAATGAGAGGSGADPQADCDVKASSPLSWIICPVVDLGANLSDFIFKDIVSPLLRDVPVSTDSNEPSFITWQQFRLIGNILLVGALLAIVYSQAKGSK